MVRPLLRLVLALVGKQLIQHRLPLLTNRLPSILGHPEGGQPQVQLRLLDAEALLDDRYRDLEDIN